MSETNHLRDLEEKHRDTIQNIENLQELEKYMFQNLQKLSPDNSQSAMEQEAVINKINELKNIRTGLMQQLSLTYKEKQEELNSEREDLSDKIAQVGIVENELDKARQNISVLENEKNNKLRMVQLYEYQRKRYGAYTDVVKYILYGSLIILGLGLLIKYNPIPFIPGHVYSLLIIVTIAVTTVLVVRKIFDIRSRDNMDFDRYDFSFDASTVKPGYQTVWQHDVDFFKQVGSEIGKKATQYTQEASQEIQKASQSLNKDMQSINNEVQTLGNGTAAGAGNSNGVSNAPVAEGFIAGSSSVVLPLQSSDQNFANF